MEGTVYHGSPRGDIVELKAQRSTHNRECIYATENRTAALLFMGKGKGDLDTRKASNDGVLELVERRPGVLDSLYNKEGYLYELDGSTFEHHDFLWSVEVISFEKSIKPKRKIYIPNILDAIREEAAAGNLVLYEYPNRPDDMPLDNSDLISKYIRFEKMGHKGAIEDLIEVYPELEKKAHEMLNKDASEDKIKMLCSSKKIALFGWPASGKSTFGSWLSSKFGIELYSLDIIRWKYSSKGIKDDEPFLEEYEDILKREEWIIEGNALDWIDSRLEHADMLVFFDSTVEKSLENYEERNRRIQAGEEMRVNFDPSKKMNEFANWLENRYSKKIEKLRPKLEDYKVKLIVINNYDELDDVIKRIDLYF